MKIIKVKSCRECPYFHSGIIYDYCEKEWHTKENKDDYTIPSWCPLEDER